MPNDQAQTLFSAEHYDEMLREIGEIDPGILTVVVPGSRLERYINDHPSDLVDES
jgi:hypothetical protein